MTITRYAARPKRRPGPLCLAIGNFDGVHHGHRYLISRTIGLAKTQNLDAAALTFDPPPVTFFQPKRPYFALTSREEKIEKLLALGLDEVVVATFDDKRAATAATDFVTQLLVTQLRAKALCYGHGFRFGAGRNGDHDLLRKLGSELGFSAHAVELKTNGLDVISSSAIRALLRDGNVREAARWLGDRYSLSGTVTHGEARGRQLGFPTANIKPKPGVDIKKGVYAVRVTLGNDTLAGRTHDGVASFGTQPVFNGEKALLEAHLFDFNQTVYGHKMRVHFIDFLRAEEAFSTVDALVEAMKNDARQAKIILNKTQ